MLLKVKPKLSYTQNTSKVNKTKLKHIFIWSLLNISKFGWNIKEFIYILHQTYIFKNQRNME